MKLNSYSKYKPTGIAWLPEVPEGWGCVPLKYFVDKIGSGKTPAGGAEVYVDEGVIFLRSQNVYDEGLMLDEVSHISDEIDETMASTRVYINDVLLNITGGSIGRCCVYDKVERANVNQHVCIIRCKRSVSCWFVRYFWNSVGKLYVGVSQQTGNRESLNFQQIGNAHLPFPPLPTQRAIVAYLDEKCGKIDRLVAAKEKEVALLKELKQSMIAEAVCGKVKVNGEGEQRKMKPSGIPWLPEVPEGWEVRRLASLFCDNAKQNKDFAYTRALKFNYGTLVPKNEVGEPEEYRDVYVKYTVLRENDIVINGLNLNYDFNSLRVACSPCDGIITSAYIVCRPHDGVESPYFTYLFKAMDYRKMFHGMGTGIRLTLSFNELRWQMLPIPPLAEQRAIVAYIEARAAKIDAAVKGLEREVAALKEYKQRLIADVVTGQRKVA